MTIRIAIAGVYLEASTFSVDTARERAFVEMRGQELLDSYDWGSRLGDLVADVEWVPSLRAMGNTASGPCDPDLFDSYVAEIVEDLHRDRAQNGPLDGLYLDMHGAMNVLGRERAEEAFLRAVRDVVGEEPVISLSMDPHGNFSRELAELVDLAACHRHSPHIDTWHTRERAVTNLLGVIRSGRRPWRAWVRVPVLLPGERTSTVVEPAATVFGRLLPAIERYDVMDANLWVGFAWADEERNSAAVLVTGYDEAAALACAEEVASWYWEAREDFDIVVEHTGDWHEALRFALDSTVSPVFVSDSGDNQTAGGTGDVTYALRRTLDSGWLAASSRSILFAGIVDAATVDAAEAAGIGAVLERPLGAGLDRRYGDPVVARWRVIDLIDGTEPGEGVTGAVLTDGAVTVTVQRIPVVFAPADDVAWKGRRKPGLAWWPGAPRFDIVVVKNGYLFPGQVAIAAEAFMALTPGATDLDFDRLEFHRVSRPLFPFDRDFDADLTATGIPPRR